MQHVNHRHREFNKYAPQWKRARDVLEGQDKVHQAAEAYLPKLKDQDAGEYAAYVKRAGFYNASWRTVAGLLGMMFRKPPQVELPGAIETYTADIDMAGTSLETFARDVALEVLSVGRVGILVDHPATDVVRPLTVAVAQSQGLRPMLKTYKAESIINWKHGRVRNHWVLTQVVLEEIVEEADGPFKTNEVKQWRVLALDEAGLYRQQIWRKGASGDEFEQLGDDIYPMIGAQPLDFIPFYVVGSDGIDSDPEEPPLIDLIDLNLSHYRTNADYEHGCHFTGLPTLFLSGFTGDDSGNPAQFYIGSQAAIVSPHPDSDGKFIEFTGQGLSALKDNLDRKEQQMAVLGARMIAQEKRVAETATTAAIHRTGENSVLSSISTAISEAIERALSVFAEWAGAPAEVTYQLNRDYNPAMLDASMLTALMKAVQLSQMSQQSFFDLMQRSDLIDSEVSFEDEQERIGSVDLPAPVAVAANDQSGVAA